MKERVRKFVKCAFEVIGGYLLLWVLLVHGLFVFLPSFVVGSIMYWDISLGAQTALWIALISLVASTVGFLITMGLDNFVPVYLMIGFGIGAFLEIVAFVVVVIHQIIAGGVTPTIPIQTPIMVISIASVVIAIIAGIWSELSD